LSGSETKTDTGGHGEKRSAAKGGRVRASARWVPKCCWFLFWRESGA